MSSWEYEGKEVLLTELFSSASDDLSLQEYLPFFLARRYQVVPLKIEGGSLIVAVAAPLEMVGLRALSFAFGGELEQVIVPAALLESLLEKYKTFEEGPVEVSSKKEPLLSEEVDELLEELLHLQVSDLHLEPLERECSVRYRVDGILKEKPLLSKTKALAIISRLKIMAGLNITQQRLPQDGRIELEKEGISVTFRVATLPTQFGESLVLRLLDPRRMPLHITELQLPSSVKTALLSVMEQPHGLLVVTGPTGSGKTTTLYSCLQYLDQKTLKLITVEDPVEYEKEGMIQISIQEEIGLTFPRVLRSLLRHDPNIIMIGEMRDVETACIAVQAALTGHRVFTTLHTNDAVGAVARLLDMGVEPAILATTLSGVLAQRLLKKICSYCRVSYQPEESVLLALGWAMIGTEVVFYYGKGCSHCHQTGYSGRVPVFEFLFMTERLRFLIPQYLPLHETALEEGMIPLRAEALRLLQEGVTTVEEVLTWT